MSNSADSWTVDGFSRADILQALRLIMPRRAAEAAAANYFPMAVSAANDHVHLSDDMLDLLSLLSKDAAVKVQRLLKLDDHEAEQRRTLARDRYLGTK